MQNKDKKDIKETIKDYVFKIDSEFCEMQGGSFVKLETGEFFTKQEHDKYLQKKLEEYKIQLFAEFNQIVEQNTGIINEQMLINKRSIKSKPKRVSTRSSFECGNEFNLVFRDKIQEVVNMKLSANEKLVFYVLREHCQFPTNCIVLNGHVPSFEELAPLASLSEKSVRNAVKSLELKGLIKRVQYGHKKAIYIHPQYYSTGKELEIGTLKLFGLVECDDEKINSYLGE